MSKVITLKTTRRRLAVVGPVVAIAATCGVTIWAFHDAAAEKEYGKGDARGTSRQQRPYTAFTLATLVGQAPRRRSLSSVSRSSSTSVVERGEVITDDEPVEERYSEEAVAKRLAELESELKAARDTPEEGDALYRLGCGLRKASTFEYLGTKASRRKQLALAFDTFEEAAQLDHRKAQFTAGTMLAKGQGVELDLDSAKYYIFQAADGGLAKAQHAMGVLSYSGALSDDELPDLMGAAFWLKKAADNDHTDSQYRLAGMLLSGDGVIRNETWAAEYYLLAAENGHVEAQGKYGLLLRGGIGVEQDGLTAARWLRKASEAGDPEACYALGSMLRSGESIMRKDPKAALYWLTLAADEGHLEAAHDLAVMYTAGEGTEPDEEGAAYWFMMANTIQQDDDDRFDFDDEEYDDTFVPTEDEVHDLVLSNQDDDNDEDYYESDEEDEDEGAGS